MKLQGIVLSILIMAFGTLTLAKAQPITLNQSDFKNIHWIDPGTGVVVGGTLSDSGQKKMDQWSSKNGKEVLVSIGGVEKAFSLKAKPKGKLQMGPFSCIEAAKIVQTSQ